MKRIALDLFARYRGVQAELHELTYLFWECTLRCDLACRHCGSDCRESAAAPDMPLADFLKVLDSIRGGVTPEKTLLVLTGGEPLLRDDLEACGRAFHERRFPWAFVTNGYRLTEARLASLLAAGLCSLTVSLDGLAGSHNWLRGRDDAFKRAFRAVACAAEASRRGLVFDVVTCVSQANFAELGSLKAMLVRLGVPRWRLFQVFPKGRAKDEPRLALAPGQFRQLMDFIRSVRKEGRILASYSCEGFLGDYEGEVRDGFSFCRAGINIGSVLADGSISACPSLRGDYVQGNIYRDDFLAVWNRRFAVMRDRSWARTGECAACEAFPWCAGNGLHLRDETTGALLRCHLKLLED